MSPQNGTASSCGIGDVEGVSGDFDYLEVRTRDFDPIAFSDLLYDLGNALRGRPHHACAMRCSELRHPTCVIRMVVRDDDTGEFEFVRLERAFDGCRIARIHHPGLPITGGMKQPEVVVAERGDGVDLEHGASGVRTSSTGLRGMVPARTRSESTGMSPVRFEQPYDAELASGGSAFFASEVGHALERAEMESLRQMLDDCFGARALLLGAGSDERVLDALPVQRRFVARIADMDINRRLSVNAAYASVVDPCNLPLKMTPSTWSYSFTASIWRPVRTGL